jgi:predicted nucleotidyltransferase
LKTVVEAARSVFGARLRDVVLYGSYARGDYKEWSDVDIMVLADIPNEDRWKTYQIISKLTSGIDLEYDILVSINVTDCATFYKFLKVEPFYQNVQREGVVISA